MARMYYVLLSYLELTMTFFIKSMILHIDCVARIIFVNIFSLPHYTTSWSERERDEISLMIPNHASIAAPDWDLWRRLLRLSYSAAAWLWLDFNQTLLLFYLHKCLEERVSQKKTILRLNVWSCYEKSEPWPQFLKQIDNRSVSVAMKLFPRKTLHNWHRWGQLTVLRKTCIKRPNPWLK